MASQLSRYSTISTASQAPSETSREDRWPPVISIMLIAGTSAMLWAALIKSFMLIY